MKLDTPSIILGIATVVLPALLGWMLLGVPSPFHSRPDVRWGALIEPQLRLVAKEGEAAGLTLVAAIENAGSGPASDVSVFFSKKPIAYYAAPELTVQEVQEDTFFVLNFPSLPKKYRTTLYASVASEADLLAVRSAGVPVPKETIDFLRLNYVTWWDAGRRMIFGALAGIAIGNMLLWPVRNKLAKADKERVKFQKDFDIEMDRSRRELNAATEENAKELAKLLRSIESLKKEAENLRSARDGNENQ